ncbi:MAG: hypothetical protein QNK04_09140 [Myxococcota bacterium]|nr:hypothetical protein [Myxococcota bacterium]
MRIRPATMGGLASILLLLPALPAIPAEDGWDRRKVVAITKQLLREVEKIKMGIAHDWDRKDKESARYVVLEDVMSLHHRTVALLALVVKGGGPEATAPVFRRVLTGVEHARRDAANFPEIEKQRRHIEAADEALAKLKVYYGSALEELPPPKTAASPPPPVVRSPAPRVAAVPGKTFRRRTTVPDPVSGCPQSVMHDVSMNHGGNVRIWVHPEVTGRNEVTSTVGVIMAERAGHFARGEIVERRVVSVPDLPAGCRIRRVLTESLASCEFEDDDVEDDSHKCDIVHPSGLVRSVKVSAVSKGLEFDCDDGPGNDAYAELSFNPIEVEVVCK